MQTKNDSLWRKSLIPNYITALRIVGTICLLFVNPFSVWFYILYTLTGITDVLDGYLARKWKITSEFGARLDSVADLMFYIVMAIKIFPAMVEVFPIGIWIAVVSIMVLRVFTYLMGAVKYKRLVSLHTYMNKLTGVMVFGIPFFIKRVIGVQYCIVGCVIAGLGSLEELLIHIIQKQYSSDSKTLLVCLKRQEKRVV